MKFQFTPLASSTFLELHTMLRKSVLPLLPVALLLLAFTSPVRAQEPRAEKYAAMILAEPGLAAYWLLDGDLQDLQGRAPGQAGGPGVRFVAGPANEKAVLLEKGGFVTMGPCPTSWRTGRTIRSRCFAMESR